MKCSIQYNVSASFPGRVYFTVQRWDGPTRYRTNGNGEGVWQECANGEWKQVTGTCQFSLTGNRSTDRRRILADFYDGDMAL